jgi:hypothetical protein
MNGDRIGSNLPREMVTQKPFNNTHEIDLTAFTEVMTEESLNVWVFREINKVVNIKPKRKRNRGRSSRRVIGVNDTSHVETRVLQRRVKADRLENVVDFVIPMARATAKTIKRSLKQPVFIGVSIRITSGRMYNRNFLWGQDPLTKGVFAIALPKRAALLDGKANKEAERIAKEDRSKPIPLGPDAVFMISKYNNPRLSMEQEEIFILFNGQDAHGGNSFRSAFLAKRPVLPKSDFAISSEAFNALLFLVKGQNCIFFELVNICQFVNCVGK